MDARQHANLDRNLDESHRIGDDPDEAVLDDLIAEDILAQRLVILRELRRRGRIVRRQPSLQFILNCLDQRIAFELGMFVGVKRIFQAIAYFGINSS